MWGAIHYNPAGPGDYTLPNLFGANVYTLDSHKIKRPNYSIG